MADGRLQITEDNRQLLMTAFLTITTVRLEGDKTGG